ncbi:uncharacterized [Tachysurus ichikawai]
MQNATKQGRADVLQLCSKAIRKQGKELVMAEVATVEEDQWCFKVITLMSPGPKLFQWVNLAANSSSCESLRQHHSWVDIVVKPISAKTVSSIELTIPVKE